MDEVEKFLDKVGRIELAVGVGTILVAVGILACFDPGWRGFFFVLVIPLAIAFVLVEIFWRISCWEARQSVESIIKKDANGREENVE